MLVGLPPPTHAAADAHGLVEPRLAAGAMPAQQRILAAMGQVAQRAGRQVAFQAQFANAGCGYVTIGNTFTALVQVSYHFEAERCALHLQRPAIVAVRLHDSPPQGRYEHGAHG